MAALPELVSALVKSQFGEERITLKNIESCQCQWLLCTYIHEYALRVDGCQFVFAVLLTYLISRLNVPMRGATAQAEHKA